ncbi:hypothetical protein [Natrinema versiforme]|uniref:Uncharacterized protein n=1 Tax=Natrinema versiforme JCM 10478 TaxID=1227496 RepID=L9Y5J6_9EURY|nr:hypothetical protein [Natrinema versiforme]ELY68921.1 hypothetical protein C489_06128 [Natrinema versiforme JCM 10478]
MGDVGLSNPFRVYLNGQTAEVPDDIRVTEIQQGTDDFAAGDGRYIEVHWTDLERPAGGEGRPHPTGDGPAGGETEYDPVVCSNCGNGEWRDHEPGDSLRCPWCESHNTLMWRSEYEAQQDGETE